MHSLFRKHQNENKVQDDEDEEQDGGWRAVRLLFEGDEGTNFDVMGEDRKSCEGEDEGKHKHTTLTQ